ncbi:MAG TPA: hypothetical protein VH186_22020 [Chloroflexia bacterium]|nr:hypothetical protein [Chloroflexia bacterium]
MPDITAKRVVVLHELMERASRESAQPGQLLEEWLGEVSAWARLDEYKSRLNQETNLWLPTSDERELQAMLGLSLLAGALDCRPAELARLILRPQEQEQPPVVKVEPVPGLSQTEPSPITPLSEETDNVGAEEGKKASVQSSTGYTEKAALLLEALAEWQDTLQMALAEAGDRLDPLEFPAEDLKAYLNEMYQLLHAFLSVEKSQV